VDKANGIGRPRRAPRIILGPVEIAGYYSGLEAGFRELGIDALAVDLDGNPYRYGRRAARDPAVVRLAQRTHAASRSATLPAVVRAWWTAIRVATDLLVFAWAVARFDVFIFSFGNSFLGLRELRLLRRLGKRVVFVFNGSDARPPYIDGARMAPDRAMPMRDCLALTRRTKAAIQRIERYSDAVVAQPAFSHFFERPVVNFFTVGVPWRDPSPQQTTDRRADRPIRILHSPSDPTVKGSAVVRETIERLRSEGLDLELIELRGVPNEVVLRELSGCDFVVDQIYSDAPMVGFATEAAVSGKPAIVGGYAWPENHRIFGSDARPPVEECTPETLADAIRHLATDHAHREELGARAREFVTSRWSRKAIAERMLKVADGSAPTAWYFDPAALRYVEGCGLTRAEARSLVAAVIAAGGSAALCVSDKPDLERRFLEFASTGDTLA
jgi:glycosyltransferase involved in cell wall biosynthesis